MTASFESVARAAIMTIEDVQELFVRAAEVDRRLPDTARPARVKSLNLPYTWDWVDKAGWGSERLEEERIEFWENLAARLTTHDVSLWERANELIVFAKTERRRRCLWAWAKAEAGGKPFARWCRDVEHISRDWGLECKANALRDIASRIVSGSFKHDLPDFAPLHMDAEIGHYTSTIAEPRRQTSWMAEGARPMACDFDLTLERFDWAERQNKRRRKREAKKRKMADAA